MIVKKRIFPVMLASLTLLTLSTTACFSETPQSIASPFSDIKEGNKNFMAINGLREAGIIKGYEDGTYKSSEKVNRAEALKMLVLASGNYDEKVFEETEITEPPFSDTPQNEWYTKYLSVAKEKGIIQGYENNNFFPDKNVNLAESLKIYFESFDKIIFPNLEDHIFADSNPENWYHKYVAYASERDMLDINLKNQIFPDQELTRGYLAELIYRKKKSDEGYFFGKATFYGAAVHGNGTASGKRFNMYEYTAAHKTLPFGTVVEVTNLANGKSVQVTITDRGPYGPGRVIDLTTTAFEDIAWTGTGVINVQCKVITEESELSI